MAVKKNVPSSQEWETKDRIYVLKNGSTPVNFILRSRHSINKPLQYFDGKMQRALRYASNQSSIFIDEQIGDVTLPAIILENGKISVPKEDVLLQEFLSKYHPDNGKVFIEFDPSKMAEDEVKSIDLELDAMIMAREMDIYDLEAIARVVLKSRVNDMSAKEVKRDMLNYARKNPEAFISIANDENIKLRNVAIRAVEEGVLYVQDDNATVCWNDKKKDKIMVAPFGQNVYSELAKFFKTDEGITVMQAIVNKL
jgi:hypothetical protein